MRRSLVFGIGAGLAAAALFAGCSSNSAHPGNDGGTGGKCSPPQALASADFCKTCTRAAAASPATCSDSRSVDACCDWVQAPSVEVQRATGLHYFSANAPTPDFGCNTAPATLGTPQTVDLSGHVKLFSSGLDSAGVKIEVFKEGPGGALGDAVGTAVTTQATDAFLNVNWLTKCQQGAGDGCKFRAFIYHGIPTETPLIIRTSDATGGGTWAPLYDYNIYFANAAVQAGGVTYDPSAVASTDVNTVASAAGGFTVKSDKGVIAGEVHDCGDVRISGAMVDTDLEHDGPMFYFTDNEADPLPDATRAPQGQGTSKLGLFGALNFATGTPIRISAVGKLSGQTTLLGTYVVQVYAGAVTALSLRGRRPWQQ